MKAFNPDSVVTIRRNGGTKKSYGVLFHVIYDVRLMDVASNKVVWRASTSFNRGGTLIPIEKRGEALAIDITNKMKEDKIFRSCPIITQET